MHMYNFLCSDSLLYFFLFLSTLHSVYTRDCSCIILIRIFTTYYSAVTTHKLVYVKIVRILDHVDKISLSAEFSQSGT